MTFPFDILIWHILINHCYMELNYRPKLKQIETTSTENYMFDETLGVTEIYVLVRYTTKSKLKRNILHT